MALTWSRSDFGKDQYYSPNCDLARRYTGLSGVITIHNEVIGRENSMVGIDVCGVETLNKVQYFPHQLKE